VSHCAQVSFSPDGRYFASASFDKAVKVWDGLTGKFLAALRGHVGAVYQVYVLVWLPCAFC
jgi:ribosome assembly protein 4